MEKNKFYITTPVYYVNAKPHLGHAYTTIAADILARFHKLQKEKTFFLVGTDEHGLKIQKKAEELGKNPQEFTDEISQEFKTLWKKLNINYDNFIRTTDEKHKKAVQNAMQSLYDKGAIYKGFYEGLYCVGCEQFLNESDLVDGKCPDHNAVPDIVKEESYLLKMTEIQEKLIQKIEEDEFKITPGKYKNEILSFLKNQKLRDVSISRKNVKWGIPLPFDAEHTSYVWFDAFLNYLTGLGWDGDEKKVPEMWPPEVQLIGKDILRVHATIWPAILIHLGIDLPKMLFIHGHILSGGKKMSKTLGNTISVDEMIEKFGVDGTRYLLMSAGTFGEDVDMTIERMTEKYNADLANGLGNLASRVMKLASMHNFEWKGVDKINEGFSNLINSMELGKALEYIWEVIRKDNLFIDENKPWELAKNNLKKFSDVMEKLFVDLNIIAEHLRPFLPETSEKIKEALENKKTAILFPRI
jgi:methionyl-tRNA synthetase